MKARKKNTWIGKGLLALLVGVGSLVVLFAFLLLIPVGTNRFDSLTQMSTYAQTVEEYPTIDNTNWFNPDYTSYYKTQVPTLFNKILIKLHLKKQPEWSIHFFDNILKQVTHEREQRKLSGACVQVIEPKENDRYFMWTDLQGAFHSLVRCLEYLREENVINNDLKLKDNCYLLFNGNLFDYGPIILQTFTLVLKLMSVNPEQVFFIRSYNEQPGGWYDNKIAKELHIFGKTKADEAVPYAQDIDSFLETLPDVLYLTQLQDDAYQAIEVTFTPKVEDSFVRQCSNAMVLSSGQESQVLLFGQTGLLDGKKINVRAIIMRPESAKRVLSHLDGLKPLGVRNDIFEWATFSSPNGRSHKIYQFFYDTIIEIDTPGPIDKWTISEYRNDVRDQLGFTFGGAYYLVNGLRPGDEKRIQNLQEQIAQTKKELEEAKRKCVQAKEG